MTIELHSPAAASQRASRRIIAPNTNQHEASDLLMLVNRKNLDVVDISTLAYNSIVALIVLGSYQRLHSWGLQILINLSIIALILFAFSHIDERAPAILRFLKSFYPLPLFIVFYEQVGNIDRVLFRESLDPLFEQVEQAIFGFQPATRFSQAFPSIWLAEYMHFAYFSYYFLLPSLGLILYLQNGRCDLKAYLFAACNTLYICCLIFIFVPVVGPDRAGLVVFPGGRLFIPLVHTIVGQYDIDGGSLPSSHVALAVVVL